MISNPLHRFSPYQATTATTTTITTTTLLSNPQHSADMDALVGTHNARLVRHGRPKPQHQQQHPTVTATAHRPGSYATPRGSGSTSAPIRRRISRACDQCNQLRTKCDGQHPCAHCIECGIGCDYARARKKRGKASRKDLAQQAAAQAAQVAAAARETKETAKDPAADTAGAPASTGSSSSSTADGSQSSSGGGGGGDGSDGDKTMHELVGDVVHTGSMEESLGSMEESLGSMEEMPADLPGSVHHHHQHQHHHHHHLEHATLDHMDGAGIDLDGYAAATAATISNNPYDGQLMTSNGLPHTTYSQAPAALASFPDLPYSTLPAHSPTDYAVDGSSGFRLGTSPLSAYHAMAGTATGSGDATAAAQQTWMTVSPSPPPRPQQQQQQQQQQHVPPGPYHAPRNMSAAAAAAAAAAHMHRYNGVAMHNLHPAHPAVHPPLTGVVGPSSSSSSSSGSSRLPVPTTSAAAASSSAATPGASPRLRYPVLEPLVPHLGGIIPLSLACDLVDLYFSSSSSAPMHPTSPYVLSFFFRKRTFLHPTAPRPCQPALLASMLWVAAQTSDAPLLASGPAARGKICQKLLELTVSLLKPLIHALPPPGSPSSSPAGVAGAAAGGAASPLNDDTKPVFDSVAHLGMLPDATTTPATGDAAGNAEYDAVFGTAGTIDDVITYMHLATVVSASEYKGASLRWWNAAWCLARELKLGREVPAHADGGDDTDGGEDGDGGGSKENSSRHIGLTEEEREERRRIWWLIYMVDRHLALCYNRPLFLLDVECDGLKRPMDDTAWQSGDFSENTNTADTMLLGPASEEAAPLDDDPLLYRGPSYECSGHNIYGFFLPLMTILGEIVDLHHARNHPRFGLGCSFRSSQEWDAQIAEITHHLAIYEQSLKQFEQRILSPAGLVASNQASAAAAAAAAAASTDASNHVAMGVVDDGSSMAMVSDAAAAAAAPSIAMPPAPAPTTMPALPTPPTRMTALDIQTRIVCAYGTHVLHVLHILLAGKWDPVNLLDDHDLWISSQGFITATGHAVAAAEAISEILEYDPGLELMPFFFGIYLLQGSFLLLLIADKLQLEASASVVRACETIIRAHEACVVTLNTEYQRNFSRVMRSALAQARGRVPEDLGEQHMRRRELLSLYRWTGDGTGLAL